MNTTPEMPIIFAPPTQDIAAARHHEQAAAENATHGLLLVARAGLDELLSNAPPRQGTPSPGDRALGVDHPAEQHAGDHE